MPRRKRRFKPDKSKYYVTNQDLLPQIYMYRETGIVSEDFGRMLLMIATNFANKGSFHGYTWKQDMISESMLTCIKYMHNFDPIKYKRPNPFAYFTSIIKNSFLNYIRKQKKHSEIKDYCYNYYHLFNEQGTGDECFYQQMGIDYTKLKE